MISKQMAAKLSEQVTAEFYSAYLYLGMAVSLESMGYSILAKRFFNQFEEEQQHGMKILNYLLEVGAPVTLGAIDKPPQNWDSPEQIVEATLEHEKKVTRMIHDLVAQAEQEKDYATLSFLQWFVDEQVEEESSMAKLLDLIRKAGPDRILLVEQRVAQEMQSRE